MERIEQITNGLAQQKLSDYGLGEQPTFEFPDVEVVKHEVRRPERRHTPYVAKAIERRDEARRTVIEPVLPLVDPAHARLRKWAALMQDEVKKDVLTPAVRDRQELIDALMQSLCATLDAASLQFATGAAPLRAREMMAKFVNENCKFVRNGVSGKVVL
jgi:hypothetical protein